MSHLLGEMDQRSKRLARRLRPASITLLRISLGLVFLAFGVLKFFPGVSPAEGLAKETMTALTLGLIPTGVSIYLVAGLECAVGLSLLTGRFLRVGVAFLTVAMIGVLAPLFLFPAQLFAGPYHAPTLEGQYVFKDIVLLASTLVLMSNVLSRSPGASRMEDSADERAALDASALRAERHAEVG